MPTDALPVGTTSGALEVSGPSAHDAIAALPLAEYETAEFPPVHRDQLPAIVARHGLLLDGPIAPMASTGVVHVLWSLGSRFVLRVPKNEPRPAGTRASRKYLAWEPSRRVATARTVAR